MPSSVAVTIHQRQFPSALAKELARSLRSRRISHKFHYDSAKQTQKWLALHRAYSPSKKNNSCARAYAQAFARAAQMLTARRVQVVGLSCGDGSKEKVLLRILKTRGKALSYIPSDSSVVMTLLAHNAARAFVPAANSRPLVCDLSAAVDLPEVLKQIDPTPAQGRVVTFFGTLHNYPPQLIAARLAALLGKNDLLLMGANMAPTEDYPAAVSRIARQYNNKLTHDWLCTLLYDLGFSPGDGKAKTVVERCPDRTGMLRIAIYFHVSRACSLKVGVQVFRFRRGERIRLFYSYRYTPELLATLLRQHGLKVFHQWACSSREEGVFLCGR